jgi:hypothetical protein
MKGQKINHRDDKRFICSKCGNVYPVEMFHFSKLKTGPNTAYKFRRSECKLCRSAERKEYYQKNKDKAKAYYQKNFKRYQALARGYYLKKKEELL